LPKGKLDLRAFFETRDDDWGVSCLGGKPKGTLTQHEFEITHLRLQRLTNALRAVGAEAESVSHLAAVDDYGRGRLVKHMDINIASRQAMNTERIAIPLSQSGARLEFSFDELANAAAGAPTRSTIYTRIDSTIREKIHDIGSSRIEREELERSGLQMSSILKSDFVDRAYNTIFQNHDELLIEGRFNFGDESILRTIGELRRLGGKVEKRVAEYLIKHSRARIVARTVPALLGRTHFILMIFNGHSPADLLSEVALDEIYKVSGHVVARLGWRSFQELYAGTAMAQPYNPFWDNPEAAMVLPPDPKMQKRHELLSKAWETAWEAKNVLRGFRLLT
jgi:hypothetical protein